MAHGISLPICWEIQEILCLSESTRPELSGIPFQTRNDYLFKPNNSQRVCLVNKNGIRERDDKHCRMQCGIFMVKEQECGITGRTLPSRPVFDWAVNLGQNTPVHAL